MPTPSTCTFCNEQQLEGHDCLAMRAVRTKLVIKINYERDRRTRYMAKPLKARARAGLLAGYRG